MARPKLNIDPQFIERLAAVGLYPEEIEKVIRQKVPKKLLSIAYAKAFDSEYEFLKKVQKRTKKRCPIRTNLRQTIKIQIAEMIARELGSVEEILGYPIDVLANHLENQFSEGMSWEERSKWHIDHIRPRSSFSVNQIKEAFALENLRPVWAKENLKKGKKWQDLSLK
jgi:hypothetical protein